MKAALYVAWVAVRELVYERVFYILLGFASLSLGMSLLLGQLTYAEQAKLTLDFMLGGMEISLVLFSVFMGISLFQRELNSGSVAMVLSKPIPRSAFLAGKFAGQVIVQGGVLLGMTFVIFLIASRFDQAVSYWSIAQCTFLIFLEITVLTAITYFMAVNSGAITASVATLFLFALGHLGDTFSRELANLNELSIWRFLSTLIPDLEIFNMKTLTSYGLTISSAEVGWATLYAGCCLTFFMVMAILCFERRDIHT